MLENGPAGLSRIRLIFTLQILDERLVLPHVEPVIEVGQPVVKPVLFLVGHAARHRDGATRAGALPGLQLAKPAICLLFRVLSHGTGHEDRDIRLVEVGDRGEASGRHPLGQIVSVRLVHLAAAHPQVEPMARWRALVPVGSGARKTSCLEG